MNPPRRGRPSEETSHPVGGYLRRRRESLGLTTRDLAVRAGLNPSSASYISQLESGAKVPSRDLALRLAGVLGDDPRIYLAWADLGKRADPVAHVHARHLLSRLLGDARLEVRLTSPEDVMLGEVPGRPTERAGQRRALASFFKARKAMASAAAGRVAPSYADATPLSSALRVPPRAKEDHLQADPVRALRSVAEGALATLAWVPIPEIRGGADPGEDPRAPQNVITVHRVRAEALEGMEPLRHPFACWVSDEDARHLGRALMPRDIAILTRRVLPLDPHQPYAVRVEGRVLLRYVKWNGRHLLLLGERDEDFVTVEAPDEPALSRALAGKVVATIPARR
ncbi:MAG: helix-turn-helix transcriptional regulator [Candidatus Eisenbacteria bacterium]|nr:helix-turn-helix transcriptional regulator [Candidatus Eisenbacteria bacterium]